MVGLKPTYLHVSITASLSLSFYLCLSRKHTHTSLCGPLPVQLHPTLLSQNHIFIEVSQPWLSTHSNNVIRTKVREKVGDSVLPNKLRCNHRARVKLMCKPLMNASCQKKFAVEISLERSGGRQWGYRGVNLTQEVTTLADIRRKVDELWATSKRPLEYAHSSALFLCD